MLYPRWEPLRMFGLTALLCTVHAAGGVADSLRVVATIKPVHSLVGGVMQGVGAPTLLLPDGASPHAYALRPEDARLLRRADLIIWVGPELETFLERPLHTLGRDAAVISLLASPDIRTLPVREAGPRKTNGDPVPAGQHGKTVQAMPGQGESPVNGKRHHHESGERDAHIWLDPTNAAAIVDLVAARLGKLDPDNGTRYRANALALSVRLAALDRELTASLAPVRQRSFFVFHDAYQYFERHYRLNTAGSITLSPERKPGARRLSEIRKQIRTRGVRCVFSEPQIQPAIVRAITRGTEARHWALDPMGAGVPPGTATYFTIMQTMARSLRACLTQHTLP